MSVSTIDKDIQYLKGKRKNKNENQVCSICYEELDENTVTTNCGHTFHTVCLCLWLRSSSTCPMCRKIFTPPEIHNMCKDILKPPPQARRRLTYDQLESSQQREQLGIPPSRRITW